MKDPTLPELEHLQVEDLPLCLIATDHITELAAVLIHEKILLPELEHLQVAISRCVS